MRGGEKGHSVVGRPGELDCCESHEENPPNRLILFPSIGGGRQELGWGEH